MIKVKRTASAGTDSASDAIITVTPAEGRSITLTSTVEGLFGDAIRAAVEKTLDELGVTDCAVRIQDRGALDYVLRARTEAALRRAGEEETC